MKRWSKITNKWEPYQPAARSYPTLNPDLKRQIDQIQPSSDGVMRYWPVRATLRDGTIHDRVYFADSAEFIRMWGAWPGDDEGKAEILVSEVVSISESPSRLPHRFADKLYRAGESGMGYIIFEIHYSDRTNSAHLAGNAVDFVHLPDGKTTADISDVTPHVGRDSKNRIDSPKYEWCLFSVEKDKPSLLKRLFRT